MPDSDMTMEPKATLIPVQHEANAQGDADLALVRAAKNGDVDAFEQLVQKYDGKMLRVARSIARSHEDAEDVIQDSFLKAFCKLSSFREDARFSTWLTRIVVNESLTRIRGRRADQEKSFDTFYSTQGEDAALDVVDWAPNPEQMYCAAELREILSNTLESLHLALRVVFVLRDMEGLSARETAETLGLSLAAVKARLFRARSRLREMLTRNFKASQGTRTGGRVSRAFRDYSASREPTHDVRPQGCKVL